MSNSCDLEIAALRDAYAFEHTMMVLPSQTEFEAHKHSNSRHKHEHHQPQPQQRKYQHVATTTTTTTTTPSSGIVAIDEYHGIIDHPNLRDVLSPDMVCIALPYPPPL